ncbi:MAG: poly(A) polymerase, partial [Syntrophomonadaceae bacterium]|nr:poly(A) polymerase [Syntrophomonadaceae bacterium]
DAARRTVDFTPVRGQSVEQDLSLRDFTINAMAIQLNGERFGELIDFFGGCRDLSQGLIRVLYNLSFVEDPTRIIRAVRFEQRYRFSIEPQTKHLLADAVERHYLRGLSAPRVRDELMLILEEKDPLPALRRLEQLGIMEQIAPEVELNHQVWRMLGRLPKALAAIRNAAGEERSMKIDTRLVYWMLLFRPDRAEKARAIVDHFRLNRRYSQVMLLGYQIEERLNQLEARAAGVRMSTLHKLIGSAPMEVLAYLMACTSSPAWQNQLLQYLKLRETARPSINGDDLKRMGLKPGPQYREILDKLLASRLDGLVKSREGELRMIQEWLKEKEAGNAL